MEETEEDEKEDGTWLLTFLAVNHKVALLVARGDFVGDPVAIGVLGEHRGDQRVGSRILGDEGAVAV